MIRTNLKWDGKLLLIHMNFSENQTIYKKSNKIVSNKKITILFNGQTPIISHSSISWQEFPSPEYPLLHSQTKLPAIFVHVASSVNKN